MARITRRSSLAAAALVAGIASGCTSSPPPASGPTSTPAVTTVATPPPLRTDPPKGGKPSAVPSISGVDAGLAPYTERARADLATRLKVAPDQIQVIAAAPVVWPDASMGCPEPGKAYAQVPTDGSLIVLRASGAEYRYHAGDAVQPFLCQ